MSKSITKEAAREKFLKMTGAYAKYWSQQGGDPLSMCESVAFSMLSLIDEMTLELPAFDLVLRLHPDDKAFNETQRAGDFVDGMVINDDCQLHDLFYRQSPVGKA